MTTLTAGYHIPVTSVLGDGSLGRLRDVDDARLMGVVSPRRLFGYHNNIGDQATCDFHLENFTTSAALQPVFKALSSN